jgi:hypothetical protein
MRRRCTSFQKIYGSLYTFYSTGARTVNSHRWKVKLIAFRSLSHRVTITLRAAQGINSLTYDHCSLP